MSTHSPRPIHRSSLLALKATRKKQWNVVTEQEFIIDTKKTGNDESEEENEEVENKVEKDEEQERRTIREALNVIKCYSIGIEDKPHHRQWILDQVVRKLVGSHEEYEEFKTEFNALRTYKWEKGMFDLS